MEFDGKILAHDGVYFATTNNSYDLCRRGAGADGLQALFADRIVRKSNGWSVDRLGRAPELPTCEQAEVLYPGSVCIEYLRRVFVNDGDHYDAVGGWLQEFSRDHVEVTLSTRKFGGQPN